jgi:hypothetical protein
MCLDILAFRGYEGTRSGTTVSALSNTVELDMGTKMCFILGLYTKPLLKRVDGKRSDL